MRTLLLVRTVYTVLKVYALLYKLDVVVCSDVYGGQRVLSEHTEPNTLLHLRGRLIHQKIECEVYTDLCRLLVKGIGKAWFVVVGT